MASQLALELAAQAWCQETTKNKVMDVELCNAFAAILDDFLVIQGHDSQLSIYDLDLPNRLCRFLSKEGVLTVGSLASLSEKDLSRLIGIGELSVLRIKKALEKFGISLAG